MPANIQNQTKSMPSKRFSVNDVSGFLWSSPWQMLTDSDSALFWTCSDKIACEAFSHLISKPLWMHCSYQTCTSREYEVYEVLWESSVRKFRKKICIKCCITWVRTLCMDSSKGPREAVGSSAKKSFAFEKSRELRSYHIPNFWS